MGFSQCLRGLFAGKTSTKKFSESLPAISSSVQSAELSSLVDSSTSSETLLSGSLYGRPLTSVDMERVVAYFEEKNVHPVYVDNHEAPTTFSPRVYFVNNVVVLLGGRNRYLTLIGEESARNALAGYLKTELRLQEKHS